ncbi:MAG: hypothetical protein HY402_01975 [Elusimicrobia bacterium]|nr:hypothetical protein [Elusimicrobiota bacterium]
MSERCFRFKLDALLSHAPDAPGVYEFVTFDSERNPRVLYVGIAHPESIHACLAEHLEDKKSPTAQELFSQWKDIYFDYVARTREQSPEDFQDIAAALITKHRPPLNTAPLAFSQRYQKVRLQEVEIL